MGGSEGWDCVRLIGRTQGRKTKLGSKCPGGWHSLRCAHTFGVGSAAAPATAVCGCAAVWPKSGCPSAARTQSSFLAQWRAGACHRGSAWQGVGNEVGRATKARCRRVPKQELTAANKNSLLCALGARCAVNSARWRRRATRWPAAWRAAWRARETSAAASAARVLMAQLAICFWPCAQELLCMPRPGHAGSPGRSALAQQGHLLDGGTRLLPPSRAASCV